MIYRKLLKNKTFYWNNESKNPLTIQTSQKMYSSGEPHELIDLELTKSEAGSLLRFIFSMIQFHSHPKKKKIMKKEKAPVPTAKGQEPLPFSKE